MNKTINIFILLLKLPFFDEGLHFWRRHRPSLFMLLRKSMIRGILSYNRRQHWRSASEMVEWQWERIWNFAWLTIPSDFWIAQKILGIWGSSRRNFFLRSVDKGCWIYWRHVCREVRDPSPHKRVWYKTKCDGGAPVLEFGENGFRLYNYYSQDHSDPKW